MGMQERSWWQEWWDKMWHYDGLGNPPNPVESPFDPHHVGYYQGEWKWSHPVRALFSFLFGSRH